MILCDLVGTKGVKTKWLTYIILSVITIYDDDDGYVYVASRKVVNKTVARVAAKYKMDNTKKTHKRKYCMFYNRFGKCNRKDKCPFIHDPEKVAVCTR